MKIRTKILTAILILIAALAVNTLIGLHRLSRIEFEMEGVAKKDVVLMKLTTSVVQHQLERGILLERAIRIGEELAFEDISPARRDHLVLNAKITKEGFENLAQKGAGEIIGARQLVEELLNNPRFFIVHAQLGGVAQLVAQIEKAHIEYDRAVITIMENMIKGGYELSFEDIDAVQKEERLLNKKLQALLNDVQDFVDMSLVRAKTEQVEAVRILWWCLGAGSLLGFLFLILIVRDITHPLKMLVTAANRMASGQYDVQLKAEGRDEFGELSRAFNHMSGQIAAASRQLQKQNIELEQSLKTTGRQKRDLERMNKDLDELVRILSYDIRSPLTNLTGYGTILHKEYLGQLDERGQRCVAGIQRGTERITQMIDDLLEMKQIVNQEAHLEPTDIRELLLSIRERLQYKILEYKVQLDVADSLPVIECDKTKIGIVFLNLLNNAIKFSIHQAGKQARIEIGCLAREEEYEFYVKDNGIGIDPAHHDEIFGLFKRLNVPGDAEGSGVGLTVAKAIVEEHGGHIRVDSAPGHGAAFFFTIPRHI